MEVIKLRKILTMDEFAKFLQLCDIKIQNKYQTKLNQIMQIDIDNKVETVMMLLLSDDELKKYWESDDVWK